ncbi:TPA: hypothetical protein ACK3JM_000638 [Mannheimia haemolytica]
MKYFILETNSINSKNKKNAGSKARIDVDQILQKLEFQPIVLDSVFTSRGENLFTSIKEHINKYFMLRKKLSILNDGDELIIQFPMVNHSILFYFLVRQLVKRNVLITLLVHDIELFRMAKLNNVKLKRKLRISLEELSVIKYVNKVIVHNSRMRQILYEKYSLPYDKLVALDIFDYLIPKKCTSCNVDKGLPIIIAGNLSPDKAGYLKNLPNDIAFNLYGVGYSNDVSRSNIFYKGSFLPDDLIENLSGSFGLVWDGESVDTCSGVYGNYLRYNNSHKASLYLAAGYPVVVWEQSALSIFVKEYRCGISVESLNELKSKIDNLSYEEYKILKENAAILSEKLKSGFFLEKALAK